MYPVRGIAPRGRLTRSIEVVRFLNVNHMIMRTLYEDFPYFAVHELHKIARK